MNRTLTDRYVRGMRRGLTIIELVVVIAILGILGVVIVSTTGGTSAALQSDQDRINEVANQLDILARAIAFFEPTKSPISFKQTVGDYPRRLSDLSTPISPTKQNSCGASYTTADSLAWTGGYYIRELPPSGLFLAGGFTLQDPLVRSPENTATQQHGHLAIVIPNVDSSDAKLLDQTVDRDPGAAAATVRYTPTNTPTVTVSYLINIGGC